MSRQREPFARAMKEIIVFGRRSLLLGLTLSCSTVGGSCTGGQSHNHSLKFTISEETTFVTQPLRADGRPDYAAALNERYGRGVTPETNAAVPLALVLDWELSEDVAQKMGIDEEQRGSGPRFVGGLLSFHEYLQWRDSRGLPPLSGTSSDELSAALSAAMNGPLTENEHPALARWLSDMDEALAAIEAASRRAHYFVPFTDPLEEDHFPSLAKLRDVANALRARSNLYLAANDFPNVVRDLMTLVRLGARIGQSPKTIDRLVAYGLLEMGREALQPVVVTGPLSPTLLGEVLSELESHRPLSIADAYRYYERFTFLSILMRSEGELGRFLGGSEKVDQDAMLRFVNRAYDLSADCMAAATVETARRACAQRDAFVQTPPLNDEEVQAMSDADEPSSEALEVALRSLVSLSLSQVNAAPTAENESRVLVRSTSDAIRLAIHRQEAKSFPSGLAETTPHPTSERGYTFRLHSSGDAYAYTATPEEPGVLGERAFCIDSLGNFVIRKDGLEPDVDDYGCRAAR